jgi:hypothetical protein
LIVAKPMARSKLLPLTDAIVDGCELLAKSMSHIGDATQSSIHVGAGMSELAGVIAGRIAMLLSRRSARSARF